MANNENGFRDRLRDFVAGHPDGWSHGEWLGLLAELSDDGVDTHDPDGIGLTLEYERVLLVLESLSVKGLGPKRREALADRFGTLWNLSHASVDELETLPSFHKGLAEKVHQALR